MTKPWLETDPAALPQLPAMLGLEERQFLYWLGVQSNGEAIVDLGTFLGASAACMAAGAQAGGSDSKIFSYDLFTYGPWCAPYDMGESWNNNDDTQPFVESALSEWKDRIVLVKGDISNQVWSGGAIDSLFVDFTQDWWHHHHVCKAFLPSLRLGGILAHQDYLYVLCYWLHIFMERYEKHFEPISRLIENSTAAWRYVSPLPQKAFTRGLNEVLTVDEMLALLDRSIERYTDPWRGLIKVARGRFIWHALGGEAAERELQELLEQYGDRAEVRPHIDVFANELRRWPRARERYDGFFRAS